MDEIAQLAPNWDSYGGNPPTPGAVASAHLLLQIIYNTFGSLVESRMLEPQIIAPRADGGIQIEWGEYPLGVDIHIWKTGTFGYVMVDRRKAGEREVQEKRYADLKDILHVLATVFFPAEQH
jgi:hypothetical protein